jgi:hypothetical protein
MNKTREQWAGIDQQAEPTDTYTAVDMATAAAQGFRDGQAAVEQAAAQDEQPIEYWVLFDATGPVPFIKKDMSDGTLAFYESEQEAKRAKRSHPGTDYKRVEYYRARPAQTEQQPVAHVTGAGYSGIDTANPKTEWMEISVLSMPLQGKIPLGAKLYLSPVVQTELVEALEGVTEGAEMLQSLIDNIEAKGNYSAESTLLFLNQALGCIRAALAAQGADK